MKRRISALSSALAISAFLAIPATLQAQSYWTPFMVAGQGATYNETNERLHIPVLGLTSGSGFTHDLVYDVQLRHTGGYNFQLESTRELDPQAECTEAEVRAAIPQLRLDMDASAVNALIGCEAHISILETDLDTGRLVQASWVGRDGVPNTHFVEGVRGMLPGEPESWRPAPASYIRGGAYLATGSAPAIAFQFREGVVQHYSYHVAGEFAPCPAEALEENYGSVAVGDDMGRVIDKLGCGPRQQDRVVTGEGSTLTGRWAGVTRSTTGGTPPLRHIALALTFEEGTLVGKQKTISSSETSGQTCGVDVMMAGYARLQEGLSRETLLASLACDPLASAHIEDDERLMQTYTWVSGEPGFSIFQSPNRSLMVEVTDGVVTRITLHRL